MKAKGERRGEESKENWKSYNNFRSHHLHKTFQYKSQLTIQLQQYNI